MTHGERIREVRKALGLTLEKFGGRIGIKKGAVSQIENGVNNLTDANIKAICREFDVSEDWIRNETGDMFIEKTRSETIAEFAGELMKDEEDSFRRRLIEALAKLDVKQWEALADIATSIVKNKDQA